MNIRHLFLDGIIVGIGWVLGAFFAFLISSGSEAVEAYSIISGWWFAAYLSARYRISLISAIPLSIAFLLLFFGALIVGSSQAIVIVSPIIFNTLFGFVADLFYSLKHIFYPKGGKP